METTKIPTQIKEIDVSHLYDKAAMINYTEIYEDEKINVEKTEETHELKDFYCKNKDCDCTNIRFGVYLYGEEEVGEIWYNYKEAKLIKPSEYEFLIDELRKMGEEKFDLFNQALAARHTSIKNTFEIFQLKREKAILEQEYDSTIRKITKTKPQLPKVGRNAPCPCGSGKKYKKCCLRIR